jgi:hypothetical protein
MFEESLRECRVAAPQTWPLYTRFQVTLGDFNQMGWC